MLLLGLHEAEGCEYGTRSETPHIPQTPILNRGRKREWARENYFLRHWRIMERLYLIDLIVCVSAHTYCFPSSLTCT